MNYGQTELLMEKVLGRTGKEKNLVNIIRKRQLQFLGHVMKSEEM